jgi:hypothetical protein
MIDEIEEIFTELARRIKYIASDADNYDANVAVENFGHGFNAPEKLDRAVVSATQAIKALLIKAQIAELEDALVVSAGVDRVLHQTLRDRQAELTAQLKGLE